MSIDQHCLETIRRLQLYMIGNGVDADAQIDFFGAVCTVTNMLHNDDGIAEPDLPDAVNNTLHEVCEIQKYRTPGSAEITRH